MNRKKLIVFILILLFSGLSGLKQLVAEEVGKTDYRETVSILQQLYSSKIMASNTDSELARKALEERYYSVACLLSALSESESIQARNFRNILNDLDVGISSFPKPDIIISETKENLGFSLAVELSKIDINYPELIKRMKPEGKEMALEDIIYAWKAEMQHSNLIKKMKISSWPPTGEVVKNSEEAQEYYVCQRCGSIVFKLPEKPCIICGSLVSAHKRIKSQALFDSVDNDTGKPDRSNDLFAVSQKKKPSGLNAGQNTGESIRPKPVPRRHEWFINLFTLNSIVFSNKAHLAYELTGLEGSMLTHYIEKELKLRVDPNVPIKVGDILSELKNKEPVDSEDYFISCISGEIQDILITSKKSETWGVLKVKYVFAEQRINSLYKSRETKQIQIIPGDNSTDKTPEAILVHKNLTRDDIEKLLQNAAKEIVDRIVLTLPSVQERTK